MQTSPIALRDQILLFAPYQGEGKDLLRINRIRTASPTVFGRAIQRIAIIANYARFEVREKESNLSRHAHSQSIKM